MLDLECVKVYPGLDTTALLVTSHRVAFGSVAWAITPPKH